MRFDQNLLRRLIDLLNVFRNALYVGRQILHHDLFTSFSLIGRARLIDETQSQRRKQSLNNFVDVVRENVIERKYLDCLSLKYWRRLRVFTDGTHQDNFIPASPGVSIN